MIETFPNSNKCSLFFDFEDEPRNCGPVFRKSIGVWLLNEFPVVDRDIDEGGLWKSWQNSNTESFRFVLDDGPWFESLEKGFGFSLDGESAFVCIII